MMLALGRFWQVLREEYVPVMMDAVKNHGVNLRLGCRVQDIDEKVTAVVLDTGERIEADLIVGVDGIRSIVRRSVIPGDVPMETSNNAYICRIPEEPILQDPELAFIMNAHALWMSSNRIIVFFSIQGLPRPHPLLRRRNGHGSRRMEHRRRHQRNACKIPRLRSQMDQGAEHDNILQTMEGC